jgi:hypothetical protein
MNCLVAGAAGVRFIDLILMLISFRNPASAFRPGRIGYDSGLLRNQDCKSDLFFR